MHPEVLNRRIIKVQRSTCFVRRSYLRRLALSACYVKKGNYENHKNIINSFNHNMRDLHRWRIIDYGIPCGKLFCLWLGKIYDP